MMITKELAKEILVNPSAYKPEHVIAAMKVLSNGWAKK